MEYWERRQELADRCACEGALCTARRSPAIPYRRTAFFGQELPIPPSRSGVCRTPWGECTNETQKAVFEEIYNSKMLVTQQKTQKRRNNEKTARRKSPTRICTPTRKHETQSLQTRSSAKRLGSRQRRKEENNVDEETTEKT